MSKTDGGLVIPINTFVNGDSNTPPVIPGLTVRDYFAAGALTGLLAKRGLEIFSSSDYSDMAYVIADAMLAERDK